MKIVSAMAFLLMLLTLSGSAVTQSTAVAPCATCGRLGAPGPVAGAGIPLLVVGAGVYWLVRRRRKNS
jgi:hypothetical protein